MTGAKDSREVPFSLAAISTPSSVLSFLGKGVAEPLLPPEVAEPPEVAPSGSVEGLRGFLGVVRELFFAMVAGFCRMVVFDDDVEFE